MTTLGRQQPVAERQSGCVSVLADRSMPTLVAPRQSSSRSTRRDHVAKGSFFFFAVRMSGAGLAYMTQILLARWMGKDELGHYVAAFSWCLVLGHVAILGFPGAALRFVPQALAGGDLDLVRGFVRRSRRITSAAGLLLGLGGAGAVFVLVGSSHAAWVTMCGMLAIPLYACIVLQSGLALGMSWQRLYTLPNNILRPIGLLAGVAVVSFTGGSLTALTVIWLHIGVMALVAAGQAVATRRGLDAAIARGPARYETRRWLATALPLMLVSIYGTYFLEYSLIILDGLLPPGDLAVFGAAHRTAFLIGFALVAVDAASLPRLSHLYRSGDKERLQAELRSTAKLRTLVALCGLVLLVVLGPSVLRLFGRDFSAGYWPTVILAAGLFVRAAAGPVAELLGITGHHNVSFLACAGGLLVAPLVNLVLVPRLGLLGAAIAVLLVMTASSLWLHRQVRRRLGLVASILAVRRADSAP